MCPVEKQAGAGRFALSVTRQQVLERLAKVAAPRGVALTEANVLSDIGVNDGKVFFSINVDAAEARVWESVRAEAEAAVRAIPGVTVAMIALTAERKAGTATAPAPHRHAQGVPHVSAHRPPAQPGPASPMSKQAEIPGISAIIAVASGKGGVGKSTTALNLALGLRDLGLRVGLLDADIYGPSVPRLTGIRQKPELNAERKMIPVSRFGLAVMSIGFLVDEETAMIWRGPMVISAITQMLRDVAWGTLDVLVVDMPPGTGDAQLTMAQQTPLAGAVIVSTPQDLALIDARRGIAMFQKVSTPILGLIENMSSFCCPTCNQVTPIFGQGGARLEAERRGIPFLGEIPLDLQIRETSDDGRPIVASEPDGVHARHYIDIAREIWTAVATGAARRPPPRIVIE